MGKNNLDKWSVIHMFGTVLLAYLFYLFYHNYTYAIMSTIASTVVWEFIDLLAYMLRTSFLLKFFDVRGASLMDYLIGYIGTGLYLHFVKNSIVISSFDWDMVLRFSFLCTFVMIVMDLLCSAKKSDWKVSKDGY